MLLERTSKIYIKMFTLPKILTANFPENRQTPQKVRKVSFSKQWFSGANLLWVLGTIRHNWRLGGESYKHPNGENLRCETDDTGNEWTTNLKWFNMEYKYCIKSDGCFFFKSIIWEFPKWFPWNFIHQEYDPETLHPFMKRMKCRFLDDSTKANSPSYSIWMMIGPATPRWQDVRWNINTNPGVGPSLKGIYIYGHLYTGNWTQVKKVVVWGKKKGFTLLELLVTGIIAKLFWEFLFTNQYIQ